MTIIDSKYGNSCCSLGGLKLNFFTAFSAKTFTCLSKTYCEVLWIQANLQDNPDLQKTVNCSLHSDTQLPSLGYKADSNILQKIFMAQASFFKELL